MNFRFKHAKLFIIFFFSVFETVGQIDSLIDSRDGKIYRTIKIDNQTWMAENLGFKGLLTAADCYDDNDVICKKYGRLYDWESAMKACPTGWHLPSKTEYDSLIIGLGFDSKQLSMFGNLSKKLFEDICIGGASGFNAQLGGLVEWHGRGLYHSSSLEKVGFFWTSTAQKANSIDRYSLQLTTLKRAVMKPRDTHNSFSVRCKKN
jgi:uncharacterized protein (TIGR02145 family)